MHSGVPEAMTVENPEAGKYWLEVDVQGDRYTEQDVARWVRGETADLDERRRLAIVEALGRILNDLATATQNLRPRAS
jgi:hypothetical protein